MCFPSLVLIFRTVAPKKHYQALKLRLLMKVSGTGHRLWLDSKISLGVSVHDLHEMINLDKFRLDLIKRV